MKSRIVRIGNSQGVRIPKSLLDQSGLRGEVELEVKDGQIIIRFPELPRKGWEEAFRSMAAAEDDILLNSDPLVVSDWDHEEWKW